jgi:predicted HAD superfamily Cof-like phosphohydrolase
MTDTLRARIMAVHAFHEAFGIANNTAPKADLGSEREHLLRYNLMREENEEYLEACRKGDLIEIADALGDMMYILYGTMCRHGLQDHMAAVFDEIHRSNMSKLDADGRPIYREDGKVLKSELYFRPDIKGVLVNNGIEI